MAGYPQNVLSTALANYDLGKAITQKAANVTKRSASDKAGDEAFDSAADGVSDYEGEKLPKYNTMARAEQLPTAVTGLVAGLAESLGYWSNARVEEVGAELVDIATLAVAIIVQVSFAIADEILKQVDPLLRTLDSLADDGRFDVKDTRCRDILLQLRAALEDSTDLRSKLTIKAQESGDALRLFLTGELAERLRICGVTECNMQELSDALLLTQDRAKPWETTTNGLISVVEILVDEPKTDPNYEEVLERSLQILHF